MNINVIVTKIKLNINKRGKTGFNLIDKTQYKNIVIINPNTNQIDNKRFYQKYLLYSFNSEYIESKAHCEFQHIHNYSPCRYQFFRNNFADENNNFDNF